MIDFSDHAGVLEELPDELRGLPERLDGLPDALADQLPQDFGDLFDDDFLYMAIGASDAIGVGATPITNGYVFQIEDQLESHGDDVQLVDLGIPAADLDTIAQVAQTALRVVEPDLVTIWVGANDIIDGVDPADFQDHLDNMLDGLDGTNAVVAIADIPDLTGLPRFREDPISTVTAERIAAFNEAIHDEAAEHQAALVRLSDVPIEDRFVSDADGFHPNDLGHARIAELFLDAVEPEIVPELSHSADGDLLV
jgi:acyl-CoA thioesterase I